jgi:integrase
MPSAWLFQDHQQKEKHGSKARWYVAWIDNEGKKQRSRDDVVQALNKFAEIAKPAKVSAINKETIDSFVAARRKQRGKKKGTTVSNSTIRKELLWLHRVLVVAEDWGFIKKVPKIKLPKVVEILPRPVTQEQFEAIYAACSDATLPADLPFPAADWWRALMLFAMTTGWRLSEMLALRWADVNLETGQIKTRAADNKGGRDDLDYLPELTIDHLRQIRSFDAAVFPWPTHNKALYNEFARLQRIAGIKLDCTVDLRQFPEHKCSPFCHAFGFHDLRRAYATENMDRLPTPVLQKKMRHKSITTTLRYISTAQKMKDAVANIHIPNLPKREIAAS